MTTNPLRICVAGATGWTGSLVVRRVLESADFKLVGAIARDKAGHDIGEALGLAPTGVQVVRTLEEVLPAAPDVLIDYTKPDSVKARSLAALEHGIRVVIGTSGLTAANYDEIALKATEKNVGAIGAGNFSITAALAKHFALMAAQYLPSREIIDYAQADKIDAPSGTARELAETLGTVAPNMLDIPIEKVFGNKDARGASIAGTQVHSLRLPGYSLAFEVIFGVPDERLSIRHDAGSSAAPYVAGTLLAAQKVMSIIGLVRGMDQLLFQK